MDETRQRNDRRFDWFGFLALAVGIGALQLMLDRGEQVGWFNSSEIVAEAIVSPAGFYFFVAHSLTTTTPFVRFDLFKDRNFVAGCLFMVVIGVVLFGTMALVTPFMQNVIGYPILTAGMLLAGRGVGTLIAMIMVGRLMKLIEARCLVLGGLLLAVFTLHRMVDFTNQTSSQHDRDCKRHAGLRPWSGIRAVEHGRLHHAARPPAHRRRRHSHAGAQYRQLHRHFDGDRAAHQHDRADACASRGIRHAVQRSHCRCRTSPSILNMATDTGRAMMERSSRQQAAIIAYANDFKLLMYLTLATIPLVFLIGSSRVTGTTDPAAHAFE